jgi:hypothetical protein
LNRPTGNLGAFLHFENQDFQEVFLSKIHSNLVGKQCPRCCGFLLLQFSLERYICFFIFAEKPVWNKTTLSPSRKLRLAGSFSVNNQLNSPCKNVQEAPCTNSDGFVLRDTGVSSTLLIRLIGYKMNLSFL